MKISLLTLTMNRGAMAQRCYRQNIEKCGIPRDQLELLVVDQGSTDRTVIDFMASMQPEYHRLNLVNEGVARGINQCLVRATGDFFCLLAPDIELQQAGWLSELVGYAKCVPNAGIVGIKCTAEIPPLGCRKDRFGNDCIAHYLTEKVDKVFGTMLFSRQVLDQVGGFHEGFVGYGFEDSDFNNRVTLCGFHSLYVPYPNWSSAHIGDDCGENSDYRRMKDEFLARNIGHFGQRHAAFLSKTLPIYDGLPAARPPLESMDPLAPIDMSKVDLGLIRRTP